MYVRKKCIFKDKTSLHIYIIVRMVKKCGIYIFCLK